MEAVKRGTTAVGVRGKDCIVLAVERKATAKLQDARTVRKIGSVDEHVCLAFSGLLADARVLVDRARVEAQSYRLTFDERPSVEHLASHIAGVQQKYTQSGGMRPFGVSFLYAGWDEESGYQLYHSDPSGNYAGWKAHAIGANNQQAQNILNQEYKEDFTFRDAMKLALKVLSKTIHKLNSLRKILKPL